MLLVIIFSSLSFYDAFGDFYSSTAHLSQLFSTQKSVKSYLDWYIQAEDRKLSILKDYSKSFERNMMPNERDLEEEMNPLKAYSVIKSLVTFSNYVAPLILNNQDHDFLIDLPRKMQLPNADDYNGTIHGILRLQRTYQLEVSDLVKGEIFGFKYAEELTAYECYIFGERAFVDEEYEQAENWFKESFNRYDKNRDINKDNRDNVLKNHIILYLVDCLYAQGKFEEAMLFTDNFLKMYPNNEEALRYQIILQESLEKESPTTDEDVDVHQIVSRNFESLCRDRSTLATDANLTCFYKTTGHPFLRLAPFKAELVYENPCIFVFHNILSEAEISTIKSLSLGILARSTVERINAVAGVRISKTAALKDNSHEYIPRLTRRVEQLTGLSQKFSEDLQVTNYGLGGFYAPHFDFFEKSREAQTFYQSKRIATMLIYLSNVQFGGGTVFPYLKTVINPEKGAALFWYNLLPDGERDRRTWHGACPVLFGAKWIATKWISEADQEFRRPCNLKKSLEVTNLTIENLVITWKNDEATVSKG